VIVLLCLSFFLTLCPYIPLFISANIGLVLLIGLTLLLAISSSFSSFSTHILFHFLVDQCFSTFGLQVPIKGKFSTYCPGLQKLALELSQQNMFFYSKTPNNFGFTCILVQKVV
jgi:hypothetical protein